MPHGLECLWSHRRAQKRRAAKQAEAESLLAALRRYRGNVSQVAEELGISVRAVRLKLRTHALNASQFR
ncbi:helix-turn-helix domain-containing protein [Lamprobacter modestohalophilus]|uniref:helix-turn-helix domain-containing protein n=1 Tax=Lamprobacter modestohalophilus TaxID=1064514 RepID=UPI003D18F947